MELPMTQYAEFRCQKQELELITAKMSDINSLHVRLLSIEKAMNDIRQWIDSTGSSLFTSGMSINTPCDCNICRG